MIILGELVEVTTTEVPVNNVGTIWRTSKDEAVFIPVMKSNWFFPTLDTIGLVVY